MKVLELFAGSRSISKAFEEKGHETFSIDWDKSLEDIDLYADISKITVNDIIKLCNGIPFVVWMSPDCTTYSLAGISHHRKKDLKTGVLNPVSDYAIFCDETNRHIINVIKELNPKIIFIENPRGGFRKMDFIKDFNCYTVTYCQYGDTRMKPTDIFSNISNLTFKPMCKNGDPCHIKAPRGSKTGTQGIKGAKMRSVIPKDLCDYIVKICEDINDTVLF